jgi:UTP-glucose-1-phosphate uridylyltransferase
LPPRHPRAALAPSVTTFGRPPGKNREVQPTDALRILLKECPLYAFEFDGRRLDIGTKQDWMRANLILGLEQEPWRSTIEDVIREHPEGQRIARRVAGAGKPAKERAKR